MPRNPDPESTLPTPTHPVFLDEPADDRRRIRFALTTAVIVHLLLFAVSFPEASSEPLPAAAAQKVYVVQQHRFKRPEPKPPEVIPERRTRKVPIPDPTPDQPEPIRELADLEEPTLELPATDALFELPEAPPALPEPISTGPLAVAGEVIRPVKLSGADPAYSEAARRARIQGSVIVQATVSREGRVTDVQLVKDLPLGLGDATVQAVRQWVFKPATLRGKPVPVYFNLTVHFGINN